MKKILTTVLLSLVALGLGAHQAYAFGGCKYNYRCCAAQYNAFSPFCCNTVMAKKPFSCKKCFHVLDCGQPACPPCAPMCGMDGGGYPCDPQAMMVPNYGMPPAPMQMAPAGNVAAMPYGMPNGMMHMTGYQPYPQQQYGYPQPQYGNPQQHAYPQQQYGYPQQQYGQQQMMPVNQMPVYWNGNVPTNQQ